MPRIFVDQALSVGGTLVLEGSGARHVQVLRMQPGEEVTLFNGAGGEYRAVVERMGRSDVAVQVRARSDREAEARLRVHLLCGAPANERMDWLVEKATELGATSIWPVLTERGVIRLSGERAEKKAIHWQSVAQAACEQCGRNRVPVVHPMRALKDLLPQLPSSLQGEPGGGSVHKLVLSLAGEDGAWRLVQRAEPGSEVWVLHGPEGGLSAAEEQWAIAQGFVPAGLGPRILRAETAALAALMAALTASF
jgi:16S rRNA (uracil1498-N3)-methyltransferase